MGAAGASGEKTYIDNVFSTYVYKGNNGNHTITNGIDNTEGGLLWTKARTVGESHTLFDTVRASNKAIYTNLAERDETRNFNLNFLSSGFSWNTSDGMVNNASHTYAAWNFRKKEGFFDVVTYTGTGSARTIAHSLGCVPGMILIKKTSASDPWNVYHRSLDSSSPENYRIFLDETDARIAANTTIWNQTKPTSTHFSLGTNDQLNGNGATYVAYVFAGGASTAATARSVAFDGANDIRLGTHSDLGMGTDDSTFEAWIKPDFNGWNNQYSWFYSSDNQGFCIGKVNSNFVVQVSAYNYISTTTFPQIGQWTHVSVTKQYVSSSNKSYIKLFFNGNLIKTYEDTGTINWPTANNTGIGGAPNGDSAYFFAGKISNLRIVKGTALYTSSFRPPYEPLTNITNTKLLCCNTTTATGATVTPGTISQYNSPIPSTHAPFDDVEGFKFGEGGDQNMIKTGSYFGNGSSTGPEINLGFEPQWVMLKNASSTGNWFMFDMMRGIVTDRNDARLLANSTNAEYTQSDGTYIDLTSTGFKLTSTSSHINGNGNTIIYIAIRRPDVYVGKPPEAGTDVLGLADSINSNDLEYISGFPVDYALARRPGASENWYATGRLNQKFYMWTNQTNTENSTGTSNTQFCFDDSRGWSTQSWGTSYQSWMWKRNAGFDVVNYKGDGSSGRDIPHSLGQVPEMMWVKGRGSDVANWYVYHNAVGNQKVLQLESTDRETSASVGYWNYTDPTSTHFSIGINPNTNNNNYLTILFASVDGISKVGSFAGSSSDVTLNLGFVPRFLMVKGRTGPSGTNWTVWDNIRGITGNYTSGGADTPRMYLNATSASSVGANDNVFAVDSGGVKGITIVTGPTWNNHQDFNYIYYAHA